MKSFPFTLVIAFAIPFIITATIGWTAMFGLIIGYILYSFIKRVNTTNTNLNK